MLDPRFNYSSKRLTGPIHSPAMGTDVTHIQRHRVTEAKKVVHKRAGAFCAVAGVGVVDAEGGHGLPEGAPTPGEHARPHGLAGGKE